MSMMAKTSSATLAIKVVPRASRDQIVGWRDGLLRLKVAAPPADGRANAAVVALLAAALGIPKRAVAILAGHASAHKRVRVEGLTPTEVDRRLFGTGLESDAAI